MGHPLRHRVHGCAAGRTVRRGAAAGSAAAAGGASPGACGGAAVRRPDDHKGTGLCVCTVRAGRVDAPNALDRPPAGTAAAGLRRGAARPDGSHLEGLCVLPRLRQRPVFRAWPSLFPPLLAGGPQRRGPVFSERMERVLRPCPQLSPAVRVEHLQAGLHLRRAVGGGSRVAAAARQRDAGACPGVHEFLSALLSVCAVLCVYQLHVPL